MPYLIDGHNLIGKMKDIRLSDPDDEMKLVTKLRSFAARRGKEIVVVFDGGLPGGKSLASTQRVKVYFASYEHTSGDDLIARHLSRLRDPKGWTLVTSDQRLMSKGKQYGVRLQKSESFADTLAHMPQPPDLGEWINPIVTPSEIRLWEEKMMRPAQEVPPAPLTPPPASPAASKPAASAPKPPPPAAPSPQRTAPSAGGDAKPIMNNTLDEWLKLFGADKDKP